jgi:hypothetical protein
LAPVLDSLADVTIMPSAYWRDVLGAGNDVLRAAAGGNPRIPVAGPGACQWTTGVRDRTGLALGALTTTGVAYLVHPEHGGSGIDPGTYVTRRQRERSGNARREADGGSYQFIAD